MQESTRRRFGLGTIGALALPLAGCLGDDGDDGEETDDADGTTDTGGDADGTDDDDGTDDANDTDDADDEDDADDADDDGDDLGLGDQYDLTLSLENGEGEAVSEGVVVEVDGEGQNVRVDDGAVSDGEYSTGLPAGEYDVTVEAAEISIDPAAGETVPQEFEPFEESVTLEEDAEVTVTLEGAIGDEEVDALRGEEADDEGDNEGGEGGDE